MNSEIPYRMKFHFQLYYWKGEVIMKKGENLLSNVWKIFFPSFFLLHFQCVPQAHDNQAIILLCCYYNRHMRSSLCFFFHYLFFLLGRFAASTLWLKNVYEICKFNGVIRVLSGSIDSE